MEIKKTPVTDDLTGRVIGCAMEVHRMLDNGFQEVVYQRTWAVELKAIMALEVVHLAQGKNYLEAYNLQTDLLINFGSMSLEFKRLFNNEYRHDK